VLSTGWIILFVFDAGMSSRDLFPQSLDERIEIMLYVEPIYRPPSEAGSLLIQATIGCSSAAQGHCYFCGSWLIDRRIPQKKFRVRPAADVIRDLDEARGQTGPGVRRIFLLDSNAMVMRAVALEQISRHAYSVFPSLQRVSVYACAHDILRKPDEDLERIRGAGVSLLYVGLESGNEDVLRLHNKGSTAEETVQACSRAIQAGFEVSITVILGLGGRKQSLAHARDTGRTLSRIRPHYLGALTLMVVPGLPVEEWIARGEFELLSQEEIIDELGEMLACIQTDRPIVFRTNHASNYLPLGGTLPQDKERLLRTIREARERRVPLRPEHMRGL
jgi:radical SAM superfamily enzyme YgiQ (UPF0313 family)